MAITNAMCTSFKKELLEGKHNFRSSGGHSFKIALFKSSASLDASTANYTTTEEVTGVGYTAGGEPVTQVSPTSSGTTAFLDFADVTWSSSTITANGALIYNTTTDGGSSTTNAVCALAFGGDKTSVTGDFIVQFPAADATNAIIRII